MRFTSLIVELIRARPQLMFWIAVLIQAAIWFALPMVLYGSPPGDMATVLAYGREYQVGTDLGAPLAFWLADLAFRAAGNHMFGVYLLSQLCFVVTFWVLFLLARTIVGGQQAVIAILLTATVMVFSFPGVEFGPDILARPLWALVLLHAWQILGQNRRNAWFALSIAAGLLLLTTPAATWLLLLLAGFAVATERGRRSLASADPWFALLVIVVLVLPYLVWLLMRADVLGSPSWPAVADLGARALRWGELAGSLILALGGIALLAVFNSRRIGGNPDRAPIIFRPPVDPFARNFVYFFAVAPALVGTFLAALSGAERIAGGAGISLVLSGLAVVIVAGDLIYLRRQRVLRTVWTAIILAPALIVIIVSLIQPWTAAAESRTSLPATAIGRFFGENYERRTGRPLLAVAGDPQLALLVGLAAPARPHVMFDATPERTPWLPPAKFLETGGVVVWRAADTAGTPPADIVTRFPGLVPEVPRAFERLINGRQPMLRIGWAIVRPKAP